MKGTDDLCLVLRIIFSSVRDPLKCLCQLLEHAELSNRVGEGGGGVIGWLIDFRSYVYPRPSPAFR